MYVVFDELTRPKCSLELSWIKSNLEVWTDLRLTQQHLRVSPQKQPGGFFGKLGCPHHEEGLSGYGVHLDFGGPKNLGVNLKNHFPLGPGLVEAENDDTHHMNLAKVCYGTNQEFLWNKKNSLPKSNYLVVSTHLKNISPNGNLPQIQVKIKNICKHHLGYLLGAQNTCFWSL